ncbi:lasso peptide biosynthesis B2 protein [Methanobacterium sp. VT]|uniref:Lasso peptide biosynthesis B2 protein n=1 Tax=Methanobacterium spitsbergense TaxID=2874285 RepID=A0A8T5V017_9EURY|nr:lasso peptide biosynthesis B2 protein [Methanobacterium spitsbergense]
MISFIRLSLSLFSFSKVKKISKRISRPNHKQKDSITIEDIIWSVRVVSPYVPKATCLTQAITGQIILSRYNHPSKLKIGVIKEEEFEAHAWLEIDDQIVLGESEKEYKPILESEY